MKRFRHDWPDFSLTVNAGGEAAVSCGLALNRPVVEEHKMRVRFSRLEAPE